MTLYNDLITMDDTPYVLTVFPIDGAPEAVNLLWGYYFVTITIDWRVIASDLQHCRSELINFADVLRPELLPALQTFMRTNHRFPTPLELAQQNSALLAGMLQLAIDQVMPRLPTREEAGPEPGPPPMIEPETPPAAPQPSG